MLKPCACLLMLLPWSVPAVAQDVAADVAALRHEIASLRQEIAELRALVQAADPAGRPRNVQSAHGIGDATRPMSSQPAGSAAADPALELLRAQVAEHAQTKVESASRLPLRLSGSIVSSTFFNSGNPNWLDLPNVIRPRIGDDRSFSSTLRQSRIGLDASGVAVGSWRGSGTLVFDFFGGIPAFQTGQVMGLPRLLYAIARLDRERFSLAAGQDDAIVAPRSPSSLTGFSFPALFRSGNLYLRVPQVRAEGRLAAGGQTTLRLVGGVAAPVAGDFTSELYTFVPPALAGERSGRPAVQGRAVLESGADSGRRFAVGVSGHHSAPEFQPPGDSWIAAIDFDAQFGAVGVAGEAFVADRAAAFGAGVGQQAETRGGWVEVRVAPGDRWFVVTGAGADSLQRAAAAAQTLRRNIGAFGGVRYALTPEFSMGLEYSFLETTPFRGDARQNHHVDWVFKYDF
jgi:hypothetical protein